MFALVPVLALAAGTLVSSSAGGTFLTPYAALEEKSSEKLSLSLTRPMLIDDAPPASKLGSGA